MALEQTKTLKRTKIKYKRVLLLSNQSHNTIHRVYILAQMKIDNVHWNHEQFSSLLQKYQKGGGGGEFERLSGTDGIGAQAWTHGQAVG